MQLNVDTAASQQGTNEDRIGSLRDQVSKLTQALHAQTLLVVQLQAANAPMPIAPPSTPPVFNALGGAPIASPVINAVGGASSTPPAVNALGGAGSSAPSSLGRQAAGSAPLPQQVLPPGVPPLPNGGFE